MSWKWWDLRILSCRRLVDRTHGGPVGEWSWECPLHALEDQSCFHLPEMVEENVCH